MTEERNYEWKIETHDGKLEVRAYNFENDVPFLVQPFHPLTGKEWENEEQATEWAIQWFADMDENNKKYAEGIDSIPQVAKHAVEITEEQYNEIVSQAKTDSERLLKIESLLIELVEKQKDTGK